MSEIIEHQYGNGNLFSRRYWKNGKLEGESRQWFQDGTLSLLEYWNDGKREGIGKSWYENGHMREEVSYQNGFMGQYRSWHESGRPWGYHSGPDGEHKYWRPCGRLTHFYIWNDNCIDYYFSWKRKRVFIKLKKLFTSNFSFLNIFLISDLEKTFYRA